MPTSLNPATGETLAEFEYATPAEVDAALTAAQAAQQTWRTTPVEQRVTLLQAMADDLRANVDGYAAAITAEMGKPISQSRAEIEKSAKTLEYYVENAPRFLEFEAVQTEGRKSGVRFDPLGVILAIMPWNYPFWQFYRFAGPALSAGNGAILKHASNVPECNRLIGQNLARAIAQVGAPEGLASAPLMKADAVAGVIADDRIAAVTLTGSTEVGRTVAAEAAGKLKKQVLELGGSDPFVVLADADLDQAAAMAVKARFTASGQSCVNAKRFIVVDEVADAFVAKFVEKASELKTGDPTDEATDVGPLARANLRDDIADQVKRSVEAGAEVVLGGEVPEGPGFFYPPTILDRVPLDAAAAVEETFGPAAAILRVADIDEAVAVANATEFGLGASVWTRDAQLGEDVAALIEAAAVFVNAMVVSDARLPFGGIKQSGYGRELSGYGLREFVNVKTVYVGA